MLTPHWHELWKQEEWSFLVPPRFIFYKSQWACQINPIDVNFHLQKSLEIFDDNSADKIKSNKDKGINVPSFIPIRDKYLYVSSPA